MAQPLPEERRAYPRQAVRLAGRLMHAPSGRQFPCQCVDVSAGGVRVLVPARVPAAAGQQVRIVLPEEPAPAGQTPAVGESAARPGGELPARIVRVDRQALLHQGSLCLGLAFAPAVTSPQP